MQNFGKWTLVGVTLLFALWFLARWRTHKPTTVIRTISYVLSLLSILGAAAMLAYISATPMQVEEETGTALAAARKVGYSFLTQPLLKIGSLQVSLLALLEISAFLVLVIAASRGFRRLLKRVILSKTSLDRGQQEAIAAVTGYVVILLGLIIGLQASGFDLSALAVIAGAVSIGIGFGLQNIANNFISGLIILAERPIKVGDRIEVGNVTGEVVKISARSTSVLTNDDVTIIVPNSEFISNRVINWSHSAPRVRFHIPVPAAYGVDARLVEKALLEVAAENPNVRKDPPPVVRFKEFGDSSLNFELYVWTSVLLHRQGRLRSELNFAIYEKFKTLGIQIPFPQRDLHLRSGTLNVRAKNPNEYEVSTS